MSLENHFLPTFKLLVPNLIHSVFTPVAVVACCCSVPVEWVSHCLVPRPHYYARPMRLGSRGPRKFLRPRQTRRSETFRLTWGGAFGSGRAVNNFSVMMKDVQQLWRVQRINRAFLFYARFHC